MRHLWTPPYGELRPLARSYRRPFFVRVPNSKREADLVLRRKRVRWLIRWKVRKAEDTTRFAPCMNIITRRGMGKKMGEGSQKLDAIVKGTRYLNWKCVRLETKNAISRPGSALLMPYIAEEGIGTGVPLIFTTWESWDSRLIKLAFACSIRINQCPFYVRYSSIDVRAINNDSARWILYVSKLRKLFRGWFHTPSFT